MNRFLGTWVGPDEYTAEVEYTVAERGGALAVRPGTRATGNGRSK